MSKLADAKTVYSKLKEEPVHYKNDMREMLKVGNLNLDFSKTNSYKSELKNLSSRAKIVANSLTSYINKEKDGCSRTEAQDLQMNLENLSSEFATLASKIKKTESDFKTFDQQMSKGFQSATKVKFSNINVGNSSPTIAFTKAYQISEGAFNQLKKASDLLEKSPDDLNNAVSQSTKENALEQGATIFSKIVKVKSDGKWTSIDWGKVGALFETGSVTESEYYALLMIYSGLQKTDDASLAENIQKFVGSAYVFSKYGSGYARGYGGNDSSFYASPILFCLESDMRDLAGDYLRVEESQISESSQKTKNDLIMKSSILSDVLVYLPTVGFSGLGIPGGDWEKLNEKHTQGGGGTVYSVEASPNDTSSFYNGFGGRYPIIRLDTFDNGKYILNVPRGGSGASLEGWMSGKMNNGNWLLPITYAQEIMGYPVITNRVDQSNLGLDLYQDLATLSRPNVQSVSEYTQSKAQNVVEGWIKGKVESTLVEYVILHSVEEGVAKTVGKEILTPLVSIPVDIAEELVKNYNNKLKNIEIDNNIEKTSAMHNLVIVGGSYKASSTNGTLYLNDFYLPTGNLERAAEIINKNYLNGSGQSINGGYLETLLFKKAVHKDAINGAGFENDIDAEIYMYIISSEFDNKFKEG